MQMYCAHRLIKAILCKTVNFLPLNYGIAYKMMNLRCSLDHWDDLQHPRRSRTSGSSQIDPLNRAASTARVASVSHSLRESLTDILKESAASPGDKIVAHYISEKMHSYLYFPSTPASLSLARK